MLDTWCGGPCQVQYRRETVVRCNSNPIRFVGTQHYFIPAQLATQSKSLIKSVQCSVGCIVD